MQAKKRPNGANNKALLAAQQEYYDARAPEYDDWWYRRGRYDGGPASNLRWFNECNDLYAEFRSVPFHGHVLDLACGTGIWTERIVRRGLHVTAIDSSERMLAINKAKVASELVEYIQTDIFTWKPDQKYDGLVMTFWLSHVPRSHLGRFLRIVRQAVSSGAPIFVADSHYHEGHLEPDSVASERHASTSTRILPDGQSFEIVKVFYDSDELSVAFQSAGFDLDLKGTQAFFIHGAGVAL